MTSAFRLIDDARLVPPDRLAEVVCRAALELGATKACVLIADHQQSRLVDPQGTLQDQTIDGSVAGRAFRHSTVERADAEGGERLWIPMLDGLDRLGVIGVTVSEADEELRNEFRRLASVTAELLVSRSRVSDVLHKASRSREMSLAAEMQWEVLPPLTAGTRDVTVAAMLEPAYDVGGDLFDYAMSSELLEFAIYDAMGHGLDASVCSTLAIGAYRNQRRAGGSVADCASAIEKALCHQFGGERFTTGIIGSLDVVSGELSWVNAGHPCPLLLRDGRVVKELDGRSSAPLGLGLAGTFVVNRERLEPGDRLLLYTDGVVENRTGAGEPFGLERLGEHLEQADAAGEELPETMRNLSQTLLAHYGGELRDDASQMLVEWRGGSTQDIAARVSG